MTTKPTSLPVWATSGAIVVPSSGKQAQGWIGGDDPSAEYLNWLANLTFQWCAWLDAITDPLGHAGETVTDWRVANSLTTGSFLTVGTDLTIGRDLFAEGAVMFAHEESVDYSGGGGAHHDLAIGAHTATYFFTNAPGAPEVDVTGVAGGVAGRQLRLVNASSSNPIRLEHQNTGSAAANRMIIPGHAALDVPADSSVLLVYSGGESRWRVVKGF